jgi:hypothetical protein
MPLGSGWFIIPSCKDAPSTEAQPYRCYKGRRALGCEGGGEKGPHAEEARQEVRRQVMHHRHAQASPTLSA